MSFSKAPRDIEIEKMIREHLERNPDLKYFMDDNLKLVIDPLIEAFSYAVHESIRKTEKEYEREFRRGMRGGF